MTRSSLFTSEFYSPLQSIPLTYSTILFLPPLPSLPFVSPPGCGIYVNFFETQLGFFASPRVLFLRVICVGRCTSAGGGFRLHCIVIYLCCRPQSCPSLRFRRNAPFTCLRLSLPAISSQPFTLILFSVCYDKYVSFSVNGQTLVIHSFFLSPLQRFSKVPFASLIIFSFVYYFCSFPLCSEMCSHQ